MLICYAQADVNFHVDETVTAYQVPPRAGLLTRRIRRHAGPPWHLSLSAGPSDLTPAALSTPWVITPVSVYDKPLLGSLKALFPALSPRSTRERGRRLKLAYALYHAGEVQHLTWIKSFGTNRMSMSCPGPQILATTYLITPPITSALITLLENRPRPRPFQTRHIKPSSGGGLSQ